MSHTVSKSAFKAKALRYFRLIEETGEELVITDNGQPVIRILPYYRAPSAQVSLRGSVQRYKRPLDPVAAADWDA
jgi:antitoxin (DNA-binding transcriptional repressor) of toxin-antitoxin stability system